MAISHSRKRVVVLVAVTFFLASVYLCAARLLSMSFTRETFDPLKGHAPGSPGKDKPADSQQTPEPTIKVGIADYPMSYGGFGRPNMDGINLIASLPAEHVPTSGNGKRLIIIGDIHGMSESLKALLDHVSFNPNTDHVIAAGDMVNKGPDSPGVVSHLMQIKASAVRGNHEDRVLLSMAEFKSQRGVSAELSSKDAEEHRGQTEHFAVGRSLKESQLEWLSSLPVILTVDPLRVVVVHAGLVPGVKLENQDPWAVMNMRSLKYPREELRKDKKRSEKRADENSHDDKLDSDPDSVLEDEAHPDRDIAIPIESLDGDKWHEAWNQRQTRERLSNQITVVYGHDAKTGFIEGDYTVGLDSGCVRGGDLTALIIEAEGAGFKRTISKVQCKKP